MQMYESFNGVEGQKIQVAGLELEFLDVDE